MEETEATQQLIRPSTEEDDDFEVKHRNLRKRRQNKTKSNLEGPKGELITKYEKHSSSVGRVLDLGSKSCLFETHQRYCVVSLSKTH